jgi:hypothetical protein
MIRPSSSRNQCDWVMAKGRPAGKTLSTMLSSA